MTESDIQQTHKVHLAIIFLGSKKVRWDLENYREKKEQLTWKVIGQSWYLQEKKSSVVEIK